MKYSFAIDLGGTTSKLAIMNEQGDIIVKWELRTDKSNQGQHILPNIAKALLDKAASLNYDINNCIGAGLGAPGPVNADTGMINGAVNLNWGTGLRNIQEELSQALGGLPVVIENDANIAAIGEMYKGAGHGERDVVMVTLGTGVGGGIICNGDILHGINGAAGEIGHILVDSEQRFQCGCGNHGCLETVASATGVTNLAYYNFAKTTIETPLTSLMTEQEQITAKDIFDAAKQNDSFALEVIDEMTNYIGLALANIAAILNPKVIVIGGGVSKAGDFLIDRIIKAFHNTAFKPSLDDCVVKLAELSNDAGIYGAHWLVENKLK